MAREKREKIDHYQVVTDQIVAALEAGTPPWRQPWANSSGASRMPGGVLPIRANGIPYQEINVWLLWAAAAERGYKSNQWMTYKQALALGKKNNGSVRKGEKGTTIIHFKPLKVKADDGKGGEEDKIIRLITAYSVFNVEQIDGLPDRFYAKEQPVSEVVAATVKAERIAHADKFFADIGATVKHGGDSAYYSPKPDYIKMPEFAKFKDAESYYATEFHEHIHWTGHEKRLNREFGKRFGDNAYAMEELVAELGAAFGCASLGLTMNIRDDHASYLANWLKILKADKRAIFTASRAAQMACEFLNEKAGIAKPVEDAEVEEVFEEAFKRAA